MKKYAKILHKYGIFLVLGLFFAINFLVMVNSAVVWWDSAVYIGMGKYIYSAGAVGLWEDARPVVLPLIVGPVSFGKNWQFWTSSLMIVIGCLSIYLVYLISRNLGANKFALLFSFLFALNFEFIFYSNKVMSDVPMMCLLLMGFYLILKDNQFGSGIFFSLAVLTKFSAIVPIVAIALFKPKKTFYIGACLPLLPFFIYNLIGFGNPLGSLLLGNSLINSVAGNYSCPSHPLFYFNYIITTVPLLLIFVYSLYDGVKKNNMKVIGMGLFAIIGIAYLSVVLHCKDIRYAFIFLPLLYILAALAAAKLSRINWLTPVIGLIILMQLFYGGTGAYFHYQHEVKGLDPTYQEFYNWSFEQEGGKAIWSSSPFGAAYYNIKIDELVYYPVFDNKKADSLKKKLNSDVGVIIINSCDIPCMHYDDDCETEKDELIQLFENDLIVKFDKTVEGCRLRIYER